MPDGRSFIRGAFVADVSEETLAKTTLGGLQPGGKVNLERALRLSDRLGGHIVTGHVDGIGRLLLRQPAGNSTIYQFQVPRTLMEYVVPKGSVAVDGISLTVAQIRGESFAAAVVPHTEEVTTLKDKPIGAPVNIEVDMMAKYVKRFVDLYADPASADRRCPSAASATCSATSRRDRERMNAADRTPPFASIEEAIAEIAAGRMLIVVDDEDRENEGDLVMAAEKVDARGGQLHDHARPRADLPAADRRAARRAADPADDRREHLRAGHGVPRARSAPRARSRPASRPPTAATTVLDRHRARHRAPRTSRCPATSSRCAHEPGGVLERAGHTEAAVDLARLAGLAPAGVICEIMNADGTMARRPQLEEFAAEHGLKMITVADLIRYRRRTERLVERASEVTLPTRFGEFTGYGYASLVDGRTHMALVAGDVDGHEDVLVRVHSECLTGDVFHSLRCDCGAQLEEAMRRVQERGRGRHPLHRRPRGPRHRAGEQAQGLRAAGAGRRHGRGQRGARLPGRPARLRHRRPDPRGPRPALDAAA